jgi:proteasome assembly chaperone (PAC2) family protein
VSLYRLEEPGKLASPILVAAFDGWIDAGGASSVAAARLADGGTTVATFDGDILFDYRARRPTLEIVDGQIADLTWPDLTLWHRRIDDHDLLVLTGAEPDFRWHELAAAVVELARHLDVGLWISLGAIPAAVPHTRGVHVLGTASRPDLLRGDVQAGPAGILRVPAAAISILEHAVSEAGIPAVGYYAQIPHYMSGPYPAAAVELLRAVGRHLGSEVPVGTLVEEATALRTRLDAATALEETTRTYVQRLEAMVEIEQFLRDRGNGGTGGGPGSGGSSGSRG